jgi:preprotein translocase subunit SecD
MNQRMKDLLKNWRVITLMLFLVFSLVSIQPHFFGNDGVTIRSVAQNSSAAKAGMVSPSSNLNPLSKEKILSFNGDKVNTVDDYYSHLNNLKPNRTITIETTEEIYSLVTFADKYGDVSVGLNVYNTPSSNLRKGLDLEGGTRVLLKPAEKISSDDLEITIDNLRERLNVYGLSDIVVRAASDLSGDDFILIEIAGVTEDEIKELLSSQGKFEAKIGNSTVFFGGKKDITYVCRSADCSGIDPGRGCSNVAEGTACSFFFSISLSPEAAERQAKATSKLRVISENGGSYLSEDLVLFLDDNEVDRLNIGAELKGSATTNIQISGSGSGYSQADAIENSLKNMKQLQTIMITGSLPVKLEIVKMDTISPALGKEFLDNIALVGLLVILVVIAVVSFRYRKAKIIVPMVVTLLSEMVMILGFAALVGWNLDLAAITGILLVAGTGVDHLIIITDETIKGAAVSSWKKKIKNAMFIVMGAYFTTFAGMLPLLWAGAGLLKGFALTTLAGISFGVLIARPAYAAIVEILLREE